MKKKKKRDAQEEDGCQAMLGPGNHVQNFGLYPKSNGNPLMYFFFELGILLRYDWNKKQSVQFTV